ncbi:sulfite exporter TauE/SafE family protein [Winogradskyella bathintestinalis]|uniref:Probable membrane transporter protein n=1 Tax=Winogradskyella bathintestinalis TaxID=3035208 RepID=A0ABT7ZUZ3_9FLAO|nr:sulfite exporter TauE/SafE family protein [Winogradskyella bathintestinalis]MDN3492805.1 sulfite exporter TauE/SafE family protein [Winogradskyella bathintestinalis]
MAFIELLGYLGALVVGLVLGLIGGGGSILTVPIMVYLIGLNPLVATAYSLFVVGTTSVFGAFQNYKKGLVDLKTAIVFAIPAFIVVYLTRRYFVPIIPDVVFTLNSFTVTNDIFIMIFFSVVMLLASYSMIRGRKNIMTTEKQNLFYNYPIIAVQATVIGVFSGIVGAGGGFLIIPTLVLIGKLPMKKAVGTSLFVIAVNSLFGFLGDLSNIDINWPFLLTFTFISIIGIFIGSYFSKFISGKKLKKGFGYFTIIMAIYIVYRELF